MCRSINLVVSFIITIFAEYISQTLNSLVALVSFRRVIESEIEFYLKIVSKLAIWL